VATVAEDNMVAVTMANYHYRDFVMNWVEHLRATGCNAFIVGAWPQSVGMRLNGCRHWHGLLSNGASSKRGALARRGVPMQGVG